MSRQEETLPLSKRAASPLIVIGLTLLLATPGYSQTVPQSFTYQGRLLNSSGQPITDTVNLTFGIYNPAGDCLLYEEKHSGIDLSTTSGTFSEVVGSATGAAVRLGTDDPALTMAQVFSNKGTAIRTAGSNCASGYTPGSGDGRALRVKVTLVTGSSAGTSVQLSPDQLVGSHPSAIVAQTLQGFGPSSFIQATGNVSDSTLATLTGGGDASTLHHHDSLYAKLNSLNSGPLGVGQLGVGTSAPGAQIQVNTGTSGTKGQILKGAASQTANLLEFQNSSGSILSYVDGGGRMILSGDPTSLFGAATKNYVDLSIAGLNAVSMFNSRSGAVTLLGSDVTTALGFTPVGSGSFLSALTGDVTASGSGSVSATVSSVGGVSASNIASGANAANAATHANSVSAIVKRDASGNFTAGTITAALSGNATSATTATTATTAGSATNFSGSLSGDIIGSQASTSVSSVGGVTAANIALGANAANAGTSAASNGALVRRDSAGNFAAGTVSAALIGDVTGTASGNISKSGDAMTGYLSLSADPTSLLHAASKNYVDFKTSSVDAGLAGKQATGNYVTGLTGDVSASGPGNAPSTINTVGGIGAASIALGVGAANAGTSANTAGTLVKRDAGGNFTAGTITATLSGNATSATTAGSSTTAGSATNFSGSLLGDVTGTQGSTSVAAVGGVSAANIALGANAANAGTSAATNSALVRRDSNGNFSAGTISGDLIGNVTGFASSNILRSGDGMTGFLSLSANPTAQLHAATKNYVDGMIAAATAGVSTFNDRSGAVTLTLTDITSTLAFTPQAAGSYLTGLSGDITASGPGNAPASVSAVGGVSAANLASGANGANAATSANTVSTLVKRDAGGNFSAGTITAALSGNATTATSATTAGTATNFSGALAGDVTGNQGSTAVAAVGGVSAVNVALGASAANAGTSAAVGSAIVRRDASGNFAAGTITAALTGHASGDIDKSGDVMTGFLSLNADPTASGHAATKNYVDFKTSSSGVQTFNSRSGTVALSLSDVTTALTFDPANKAGDTFNGFITLSADPTAALHGATKNYVDIGLGTKQGTGSYLTALTGDISASGPGSAAGTVNTVGGVSATNVALGANAANSATNANTVSTLVKRDGSGNFSAGIITAALSGNATTATSATTAGTATNFSGALSGDVNGTQALGCAPNLGQK